MQAEPMSVRPETEQRVRVLEKHIIYVKELEKPTPEAVLESAREVSRLSEDWEHFGIVVEFTTMVVPSSEVRHMVSEELSRIRKKLVGVAVVTDTNVFLRVGFRFIGHFAGLPNITFHKTNESAVRYLTNRNKSKVDSGHNY